MFLTFLQSIAGHILYLALHLDSGSFPRPLSPAQEKAAFAAMAAGDPRARDTIIRHNLRLVAHIAKKYYAGADEQDDLVSIGTIGLIKAVSSFDSTRQAKFSTYAARCVENELRMHFRKMRRLPPMASLNDPIEVGKGESALTMQDVLTDPFVLDEDCALRLDSARLRRCVEGLDARSRQVLMLRYGLGGQEPLTQLQTASILGISRSYVSRLESKALQKLKDAFQPEDIPP